MWEISSVILTGTCGDTICMPVPFMRSGFNRRGTAGDKAGSLVPLECPRAFCSETTAAGLDDIEFVVELGTVGNGVCRK